MFEIYKLTNIVDMRVYIGVTKQGTEVRFDQHCRYARKPLRRKGKSPSTVQRAIRIHGEEYFVREVIDRADSKEEAWQKERYWIRIYKSNDRRYGYNRTRGGDGIFRRSVDANEIGLEDL